MGILSMFPGGGGAKLDVTAYASVGNLPDDADEGAVAVITATAVADSYADSDFPPSPAAGDVFILLGGLSYPIPLTKLITIYPRGAYQYESSTWVLKETYVYLSGSWTELLYLLYNAGTFYMGNGFPYHSGDKAAFSLLPSYMQSEFSTNDPNARPNVVAYATYTTDLTGINTIRFLYSRQSTRMSGKVMVASYCSSTNFVAAATMPVTYNTGTQYTIDLDVSALSGKYYIGTYFSAPYCNEGVKYGRVYKIEFL
jgi:hypothetical protein